MNSTVTRTTARTIRPMMPRTRIGVILSPPLRYAAIRQVRDGSGVASKRAGSTRGSTEGRFFGSVRLPAPAVSRSRVGIERGEHDGRVVAG